MTDNLNWYIRHTCKNVDSVIFGYVTSNIQADASALRRIKVVGT